ncbi:MAG: hypothetical protein N2257_00800 [Thermodesulfovibrionales bacterium]|nr:hypothetical protein [Thermodesulfovibrionales bacterium]
MIIIKFIVLLLMIFAGSITSAESEPRNIENRKDGLSVNFLYLYRLNSNISDRSRFNLQSMESGIDWNRRINERLTAGFGLNYEYSSYSFSGRMKGLIEDPWGDIHSVKLSVSFIIEPADGFKVFVSPYSGISAETGAELSESLEYGAITWTSYRFSPSLTLGLGAGIFSKPEKISIFPVMIINWRITDRLRIANSQQTGPAGPAGIELSYKFNRFTLGTGAGYQSKRFRLDEDGPVNGGIGEDRALPVWLRISSKTSKAEFNLYSGLMLAGRLTLEDREGREILSENYDSSPFFAINLSLRL